MDGAVGGRRWRVVFVKTCGGPLAFTVEADDEEAARIRAWDCLSMAVNNPSPYMIRSVESV